MSGPLVAAALKWQPLRLEVDPLTGAERADERFSGASAADEAALEWALRLAEAWSGEAVAVCAGPPAAEAMLRGALAAGAASARRVELPPGAHGDAAARALAPALERALVVVCGDYGLDRGSGAVPALLADGLGAAQALGLIGLEPEGPGVVRVERRLDGGRRERLRVRAPAVLSVEGAAARLRRAPLPGAVAARTAAIEVVAGPPARGTPAAPGVLGPYRPRPRALDPPDPRAAARERIHRLTSGLSGRSARQVVRASPEEAADELLAALRRWGYLEEP